jgi:hypothetical protein
MDVVIELENKEKVRGVKIVETTEKSVVLFVGMYYANLIDDYEFKYNKNPNIYIGEKMIQKYIRLDYENVYHDDEEFGKICLFPLAKYVFYFE